MPDKLLLVNENGESLQTDIVSVLEIDNKTFIISTNQEVDPNGLTVLHVSELANGKLIPISAEDESNWNSIKIAMRSIISGSQDTEIKYGAAIEKAECATPYSRDISVESSALNVMMEDYKNKKPSKSVDDVNNPIYPTNQSTQIVNDMGQVQISSQVAPGINEVKDVGFEEVVGLGNPVDLVEENNTSPEMAQSNMPMPNINQNLQNQQAVVGANVANMLTPESTVDEALNACINITTAALNNLISFIGMKKSQELELKEQELNRREIELNAMRQGLESKLTMQASQFSNPVPQQTVAQPMMPQEPVMQAQPIMAQEPMMQAQPVMAQEPMMQAQPVMPQEPMMAQQGVMEQSTIEPQAMQGMNNFQEPMPTYPQNNMYTQNTITETNANSYVGQYPTDNNENIAA